MHTNHTRAKHTEAASERAAQYRRRFAFPIPEAAQCIHYEENEEISVRIYRLRGGESTYDWDHCHFLSFSASQDEKVRIQIERQRHFAENETTVRLFSEGRINVAEERIEYENAYYTLHICNGERILLFRAFSQNERLAHELFDRMCALHVDCFCAPDVYRAVRDEILREAWFFSF